MPGWSELLQKYGSNSVWQKTGKDCNAVPAHIKKSGIPLELIRLCPALSTHGLALEWSTRRFGFQREAMRFAANIGNDSNLT